MKGFKEFSQQLESSARTRRAMGVYPPQADDVFARPPYSAARFCKKAKGAKLVNMDPSGICGKKV